MKNEILLVEDSNSDAELMMRALKKGTLQLMPVHLRDGAEALEYIFSKGKYENSKREFPPALIILDLKMPKMNGLEVLKALKEDKKTHRIPTVVFTSSKEDEDIKTCYALGVNSYVVKPVETTAFLRTVSDLCAYWTTLNQPPV